MIRMKAKKYKRTRVYVNRHTFFCQKGNSTNGRKKVQKKAKKGGIK